MSPVRAAFEISDNPLHPEGVARAWNVRNRLSGETFTVWLKESVGRWAGPQQLFCGCPERACTHRLAIRELLEAEAAEPPAAA